MPIITTIHYKGYLITQKDNGKYQWRLSEFETEQQAFKTIDEHILHYSIERYNVPMLRNGFPYRPQLCFLLTV